MNDLRTAAQQALEFVTSERWGTTPYMDVCVYEDAARLREALRAALAQQAEPMEPVAWECKAEGLKALTQRQYDAQPPNIKRHYTRIAPPQRLPLTEEEIDKIFKHLCNTVGASYKTMARAAERAVWEKNHE